MISVFEPNWSPFSVIPHDQHPPSPRPIQTPGGVGDRLRAAAFAEVQAREGFLWAANQFADAPSGLRSAWKGLAIAEQRHLDWLLKRMEDLEISLQERPVSSRLWHSFLKCEDAEKFSLFMASAEDRGRQAGERFYRDLLKVDPVSAVIFRKIAEEEVEHIELAYTYYPHFPRPISLRPKTT